MTVGAYILDGLLTLRQSASPGVWPCRRLPPAAVAFFAVFSSTRFVFNFWSAAMASGGILERLAAPVSSPSHKKAKPDGALEATTESALDNGSAKRLQALTCLELTQMVLSHDRDLNIMMTSQGLIYKMDKEHPVAARLLQATRVWQDAHQPGKPHELGSCGTAVGTVLLQQFLEHGLEHHKQTDEVLLMALQTLLQNPSPALIAREVAFCQARLNAKKTFLIVDFRLHAASHLHMGYAVLRKYMDSWGEALGPKPSGPLVRKALRR